MSVYESCPVLTSPRFTLRLTAPEDAPALLRLYSDPLAVPLFNCDNCHYGAFRMETLADMRACIDAWLAEYRQGHFVRWTILAGDAPIGTVELFHRVASDAIGNHGLLRLDLRSDWETRDTLEELLALLDAHARPLFGCPALATKAAPTAVVRRLALEACGWRLSPDPLVGHNGTLYGDYWVK